MNKRRFHFHYNKPASKKAGFPKLTLHCNNTCYLVDKINCTTSTESHNQKRQPHCVIRGWANTIDIDKDNNIAYIN